MTVTSVAPAVLPAALAVAVYAALAPPGLRLGALASGGRRPGHTRRPDEAFVRRICTQVISARAGRGQAARVADDIPDVVDLLGVAAAAGCNVRLALEALLDAHVGPAAAVLERAARDVKAGARTSESLDALLDRVAPATADALRPLVAVLIDSDRYGTPLVPALARVSTDVRAHRQRRAEERARRIPVRLLLPLVLCVLPAFALLTVAPLLAGIARDALADSPVLPIDAQENVP